jgi:hypothetical protein
LVVVQTLATGCRLARRRSGAAEDVDLPDCFMYQRVGPASLCATRCLQKLRKTVDLAEPGDLMRYQP